MLKFMFKNLTVFIVLTLIFAIIGGFCWQYTLNTWLTFLDKPADIVWWQGALISVIPPLGQVSIAVAVITWILMLFL